MYHYVGRVDSCVPGHELFMLLLLLLLLPL